MRKFVGLMMGVAAVVLPLRADEPGIASAWAGLQSHPRLFASAARFAELKKEVVADPVATRLYGILKKRADGLLGQPPVTRTLVGRRLLATSRRAEERILVSALVARISGEEKYRERALVEMRALAAFEDWNPSHFLDVAEATFGMATGYDWLLEGMSAEDRKLISEAIINKGLKASLPGGNGKDPWWVKGGNNWNQVCHGGMVAGALAVAEQEPELAKMVVERAVANLRSSAKAYAPDGVYPEGPSYWEYGSSFHVALVSALRSALGSSFEMEKFPGFLKTADYYTQMTAPSGGFFNYSDGNLDRPVSAPMFWFARELARPELLRQDLSELPALEKIKGTVSLERFLPLALVWYQPSPDKDGKLPPKSWTGAGAVPVAVHRSGWDDPMATFLAVKGGWPSISHGHMDVGGFVMESDGRRWAVDLGAQEYNSLESKGIDLWASGQEGERWGIFRLGPDSHNIPRFNDAPQRVNGRAVLVKSDAEKQSTILDLTALYEPEVKAMRRGVKLEGRNVVIRDEWETGGKPAMMAFQWLTRAEVKVEGQSVILTEATKSLRITASAPGGVKIEVSDVSKPVKEFDLPNPGLTRIRFVRQTPAASKGELTVAAFPGGGAGEVDGTPLAEW